MPASSTTTPARTVSTLNLGRGAGVVVEDAGVMAAALAAIEARVGRLVRSKNAFRADADVSYGYRAFLGNLQLESGLTVGEEGAVAVAHLRVRAEGVLAAQQPAHARVDRREHRLHHARVLHDDTGAHRVHVELGPGQRLVAVVLGALQLVEHARAALDGRPRDREQERTVAAVDAHLPAVHLRLRRVAQRLERRAQLAHEEVVERDRRHHDQPEQVRLVPRARWGSAQDVLGHRQQPVVVERDLGSERGLAQRPEPRAQPLFLVEALERRRDHLEPRLHGLLELGKRARRRRHVRRRRDRAQVAEEERLDRGTLGHVDEPLPGQGKQRGVVPSACR